MAEIELLNIDQSDTTKIARSNRNFLVLEGLASGDLLDSVEIDNIYDSTGLTKQYQRGIGIGNTSATYTNWTWLRDRSGYSLWKYNVSDYNYNSNNKMYVNGQILDFMGQASSEAYTAFDRVLMSGAGGFVDVTAEASTISGTPFNLVASGGDMLYIGHSGTFAGFEMNFNTYGNGYSLVWQYYSGSDWYNLALETEETSSWMLNGKVEINSDVSLSQTVVNGETIYWIRAYTTLTPTTVAKAYYITPTNNVVSLLTVSTTDLINKDWKWCSSGQTVYVTIPNTGYTYHEGRSWIQSGSTSAYLESFYTQYYPYTMDYKISGVGTDWNISGNSLYVSGNTHLAVNNGNVSIGMPESNYKLGISSPINTYALSIGAPLDYGNWIGIKFGFNSEGDTQYHKAGIIFERNMGSAGDSARGKLHFATNNVNDNSNVSLADSRMTIDAAGNVSIGMPESNYQLELSTDSAGKPGAGGLWTVVSDERLKENIILADIQRCYDIVKTLPLKRFTWKDNKYTKKAIADRSALGWIAQDVKPIFNKSVNSHNFEGVPILDGEEEYEEQEYTTEIIDIEKKEIKIIDGKPIQTATIVQEEKKTLLFNQEVVVDEQGNIVIENNKPKTCSVPRMVKRTRPKYIKETIKDCLNLDAGQIYAAMYGALQKTISLVEELNKRVADLENRVS